MYPLGQGSWLREGWDLLGWEGPPMPGLWAAVLLLHGGNLGKSPLGGNRSGSQVLFLGFENVPRIIVKTVRRKTKAWSLLCRGQDQSCLFSSFYHGFHSVCRLISMLSFWSLMICANCIYVNIFGHSTYPEANLCVPGEQVAVNGKCRALL